MTQTREVYRCSICGNITEVLHPAGGQLVCCNQPMIKLEAGTTDAAQEKHVPMIETQDDGYLVIVGSVEHPMEEDHYIEWIDLVADEKTYREHLKPGQKPQAFFPIKANKVTAREYCNLHGLWKKAN